MLNKIGLDYVPTSNISAGLEIFLLLDGTYEMNLVILKKNKGKLSVEKQQEGISNFQELSQLIHNKCPITIILNGKGIIHKKVNISEGDTNVSLLNKVLPNANLNDFIIQQTPINETETFVSVIRASILNEITDQLRNNTLTSISECVLGPFIVSNLLPLVNSSAIINEKITIGKFQLKIHEQQITDIATIDTKENLDILIAENPIAQKLVIAFAGALSYFTDNVQGISNSESIAHLKDEFRQKQKFEFRAWVLMAATFLILLINYFIFDHYWTKGYEMRSKLATVESALQNYETLQLEFKQKKNFLEQNGLLENSRTSFYIDQLAQNLPASIQWTDVTINPLKKKDVNEESDILSFENKTINVSGNCKSSHEMNNWMKDIKKLNWIRDVTMVNYKQDNAQENGFFFIEIKVK